MQLHKNPFNIHMYCVRHLQKAFGPDHDRPLKRFPTGFHTIPAYTVYSQARAAMVRLGADERTLKTFKLLSREDVKASTAILDPNIPGSTTIRLSWIWETGAGISGSASDTMQECKPCTFQ